MTRSHETMRAFALNDFEAPPTVQRVPVPEVGAGDVLVRVRAASINAFDAAVSSGALKQMKDYRFPVVIGSDFAGVVERVGADVTAFAVGDEVLGLMPPAEAFQRGSYADYVVVPADSSIAIKPANLTMEEAASLGLAATAAQAALDAVGVAAGERILVVGATGGVGNAAVQLAAARGAHVIATGLVDDETSLRDLGATEVVDYTSDIATAVRARYADGIDALIDLVSRDRDSFSALTELLRPGGRAASSLGAADVDALAARDVLASNISALADAATFTDVVAAAAEGQVRVVVTEVFALADVADGLDLIASGKARGKLAVSLAA